MTRRIEVLYFAGCPNHEAFVPHLRALLEQAGVEDPVRERAIETEEAAEAERFLGSPTVRIDGRDVDPGADQRSDYGLSCRLYRGPDGLHRTPPDDWILDALRVGPGSASAG